MSDLQTALFTALKEWEPSTEGTVIEAATASFKTPRNMTRDCFAMVRDNPGITRNSAVQRLEAMGHKPKSTTSILSQMVKTKMISETSGVLSTKRKNYTPLQAKVRRVDKAKPQPKAVVAQAPAPSVAAPKPQPTHSWIRPEPIKEIPKPVDDKQRVSDEIDAWLNNVTLRYASLVYERLHYIFGAQK